MVDFESAPQLRFGTGRIADLAQKEAKIGSAARHARIVTTKILFVIRKPARTMGAVSQGPRAQEA
jgi:hypothetical protein